MRPLLAHQLMVLADAILIFTLPNDTAHQSKEGKGSTKMYRNKLQKNHLLVNEKGRFKNEKRRCRDG